MLIDGNPSERDVTYRPIGFVSSPVTLVFALLATLTAASPPVFYKDVLPILQQHCQACHRAGEIAPMALTTWRNQAWANAIREKVTLRQMPPWFANPQFGHFANDPSLTADEIRVIQAWAETAHPRDRGRKPRGQ